MLRSATMMSRVRITPRTALVLGGSAMVGFAVAEPARADPQDTLFRVAGGVGIAAALYAGYSAMVGGAPEYSDCPPYNSAFVFLKPHAATEPAKALVKAGLEQKGFKVLAEGELTGSVIDSKQLIDNHYYSIASKATILEPKELNVPADKFAAQFGIGWQEALDKGVVFNALQACKHLGIDGEALDKKWGAAKKSGNLIKFGGGFYCAFIDNIYIFNGFFMEMRGKYTGDAKINWVRLSPSAFRTLAQLVHCRGTHTAAMLAVLSLWLSGLRRRRAGPTFAAAGSVRLTRWMPQRPRCVGKSQRSGRVLVSPLRAMSETTACTHLRRLLRRWPNDATGCAALTPSALTRSARRASLQAFRSLS
jgi:hypothetical protein